MEMMYQTKKDPLQNYLPAIPELLKLISLEPASFHSKLAEALEQSDCDGDNRYECNEKDQSSQEDIRGFNSRAETDSFDASDDNHFRSFGDARISIAPLQHLCIGPFGQVLYHIYGALLDLNGSRRQSGKKSRRGTTCRPLIPRADILHEADSDDSHAPLEILSPGLNDRRQWNASHADDSLGLEKSK